jgi:hypothetical protein
MRVRHRRAQTTEVRVEAAVQRRCGSLMSSCACTRVQRWLQLLEVSTEEASRVALLKGGGAVENPRPHAASHDTRSLERTDASHCLPIQIRSAHAAGYHSASHQ